MILRGLIMLTIELPRCYFGLLSQLKECFPGEFIGKSRIMAIFCIPWLSTTYIVQKNDRLEKIEWSWSWRSAQTSTLFNDEQEPLVIICGLLFSLQPVSFAVSISHDHTTFHSPGQSLWSCCTVHERSTVRLNVAFNLEVFMGHQSACKWLPDSVNFCADMWTGLCHVTTVKARLHWCLRVACCCTAS